MKTFEQISRHFHNVIFGGNWSDSNLKDHLSTISWKQAVTKVHNLNTIATLVFHLGYYVEGISRYLEGNPLTIKDKYSFDHPPINSKEDWENMIQKTLKDAEIFTKLIAQLPEDKLTEDFVDKKYGSYHSNLLGIIEHTHYHLGQIVIIKKIIDSKEGGF